jgi:hypothetical protein
MARKSVLVIGEDPAMIDFGAAGAPPDMSAEKVMAGLGGSLDRLRAAGHPAELLLTDDSAPVEEQVARVLEGSTYDIIVVGAGLRTLPSMAQKFERIVNAIHRLAPGARLAFNSRPGDSDEAALRWA